MEDIILVGFCGDVFELVLFWLGYIKLFLVNYFCFDGLLFGWEKLCF